MSKSYSNTIALREAPDELIKKIRRMPTDPARIRRHCRCGNPDVQSVWRLHEVYSDDSTKTMGAAGVSFGRHWLFRM